MNNWQKRSFYRSGLIVAGLWYLIGCGGGGQKPAADSTSVVSSSLRRHSLRELRSELLARKVFLARGRYTFNNTITISPAKDIQRPDLEPFNNDEVLGDYRSRLLDGHFADIADTTIYDVDTRMDIKDVQDPVVQQQALGVGALISRKLLTRQKDGSFKLTAKGLYRKYYNICTDGSELFLDQPVCADCTSFAVSGNTVVTAGHCIQDQGDAGKFYVLFDFRLENIPMFENKGIPDSLVYEVTEVVDSRQAEADYAICRVNKTISKRRVIPLDLSGGTDVGNGFYVMGFPGGLPMKYADEAVMRDDSKPHFFVVAANTFQGNSGAPLLSATKKVVEGILVRGEKDFEPSVNQPCSTSVVCRIDKCRGEDATRISDLLPMLGPLFTKN